MCVCVHVSVKHCLCIFVLRKRQSIDLKLEGREEKNKYGGSD